jgi:[ribosomal protein S5]-alanine N-acetyltransferase
MPAMPTLIRLPAVDTRALILREVEHRDVRGFARYMIRPDYQLFIASRQRSEAEVRAFVSRCLIEQRSLSRKVFHVAAESKRSGATIGDGFLIMRAGQQAEIGWGVAPQYWRQGLGTEIARALAALAVERLGAEQVWCKVMTPNRASLRVAEKSGFTYSRTVAAYETGRGQHTDVKVFEMTRPAYFEAPY